MVASCPLPVVLGLTGGIATGKSSASRVLRSLHIPVIDADAIARDVAAPHSPALWLVRRTFGPDLFFPDGSLDRAALGRVVFADPAARRKLNRIMHPFVIFHMTCAMLKALLVDAQTLIVLDVPLLFETRALLLVCSATAVVNCGPETQVERLCKRDGFTREEAEQRINAQMSMAQKCALADFVVQNDGAPEELEAAITTLSATLRPPTMTRLVLRAVLPLLSLTTMLMLKYVLSNAR
mmetsp:Transcript_15569/g.41900  ORF Transcript_15569/g.41900 Transcript_15569/m.41900 type:complete len:238 (+) Transcript_15569:19-732(+)